MSLSLALESANAASAATMEPQRKSPPRRSPRLAVLDRHPTALSPTATSPIAASSNKRSIEEVHGNGSSGGVGGGNHSGDPAAMPEAKAYSVTRSGKRTGQKDIDNNGGVRQQVAAAATAAGAKSSATRSSKRRSHGPDEESNRVSGQHQVADVAATAAGFNAATAGFKKTSAATRSSQDIDDERNKDSGSDQHIVVAAQPVVKAPATISSSTKISPDIDEESNTGSCCQEVLPPGGASTSVAASFFNKRSGPQVAVAAPAVASASATSSGERRSSPKIDTGNEGGGHEQIFASAPAALAPTIGCRQDSRQKDNNGGEVVEAAEAEALATSSRERSIPGATKGDSNSTIAAGTTTISPHMAILRQVQADLGEAVYTCEELLGNMEEDLLMRQPNAMSVARVAQGSPAPVSSPAPPPPPSSPPSSMGALGPSRGIALHLKETRPVREVEPRERMFSQSSRTSVFWRSPVSRRQRTGEYRHGIDSPPVGCYASDGMITRAQQQQQQQRGGAEGQQVVGYDVYRNRWVPLSRRGLEQLALEQAKARGLCGGGGGGSDDAAATAAATPGCYPSKGSRFGIGQGMPVTAVRRVVEL